MADTVRYLMEEMVPELEDLEQRGYFSKPEIKAIVKRRMDFEYLLKRRAPQKTDYLRYVEYEMRLEELRVLRRESLGLTGKKSVADYGGVRRMHFIFERACQRFKGDLRVWMRWLQFCRDSNSPRMTSKVLTKALQLHPTVGGLWSTAAAWEFEHNANATAARTLMQRGLRLCRGAPQLWVEYFRMELLYAHKLRARRKVLGIPTSAANPRPLVAVGGTEAEAEGADASEAAVQAVLSGSIALVVYRNAIATIPRDLAFRRKFLQALRPFTFPGAAAIEDALYTSIEEDFGGEAEAWDVRAQRQLQQHTDFGKAVEAAMEVYTEALQQLPTMEMFDLVAGFLRRALNQAIHAAADAATESAADLEMGNMEIAESVAERLLQLAQRATDAGISLSWKCKSISSSDKGVASEALLLEWPRLALRCGRHSEALAASAAAVVAQPTSLALRHAWLAMRVAQAGTEERQGQVQQVGEDILQAVRAIPRSQSAASLWIAALQALTALVASLDPLLQELEACLMSMPKGPLRGGMGSVAAAALEAVRLLQGVAAARQLYRRLLRLPSPGGSFHLAAIHMELADLPMSGGLQPTELRRLFEAAVEAHGAEDLELWLRYKDFASTHPGAESGNVHWRAVKALQDPDAFIAAVQMKAVV